MGLLLNEAENLRTNYIKKLRHSLNFLPQSLLARSDLRIGKKANDTSIFKKDMKEDFGYYRLVSPPSVPGRIMEQIFLKRRHMKEKNVTEKT